ncbi:hypothetical protein HMPREF1870_00412 [Bacteroidales bacterium KA00344]|nr:hypothetical protein HMPREF1870_00412 [Bacteroidales bacterium KA00344]
MNDTEALKGFGKPIKNNPALSTFSLKQDYFISAHKFFGK